MTTFRFRYIASLAWGSDIFAYLGIVSDVLLITLTRLRVIKLTEIATLSLEMLFAIVAELGFITMKELGVIGKVILINWV